MTSSLRRAYFVDSKLRERALTELVRAFETGRLIAFVGSMATESLGYGSWNDLIAKYLKDATETAGGISVRHAHYEAARAALDTLAQLKSDSGLLERRAALSLAKEALATLDEIEPIPDPSRVTLLERAAAEKFGSRGKAARAGVAPIKLLAAELAIRRFATLNYDLELEAELMVEPGDLREVGDTARLSNPRDQLDHLIKHGIIRRDPEVRYRLSRLMANGIAVESDVRDRERPDRMIEFAVGAAEVDQRIMHLHGRADEAGTMIVSLRDYDRLYRKDDIAKLPFEHGQRILFAGNPVLFVGVGMTEPEVNDTLRNFVSNNPHRRFAPTFLLWNTAAYDTNDKKRMTEMWLKRVDFLQRLGVLTIFDDDLHCGDQEVAEDYLGQAPEKPDEPRPAEWRELDDWLDEFRRASGEIKETAANAREANAALLQIKQNANSTEEEKEAARDKFRDLELDLLAATIPQLARAGRMVDIELRTWKGPWRSLQRRFAGQPRRQGGPDPEPGEADGSEPRTDAEAGSEQPIALWDTLWRTDKEISPDLEALFPEGDDGAFKAIIAQAGSGKGSVAYHIAQTQKKLPSSIRAAIENRMIINAGYAFDTDLILLAVSRFLLKLKGRGDWHDLKMSREQQFEMPQAFSLDQKGLIIVNGMERFFTVDGAPLSAELDHLLRRIAVQKRFDVRWLFFGTPRIERYFENLAPDSIIRMAEFYRDETKREVNSVYLNEMIERVRTLAPGRAVATPAAEAIVRAYARAAPRQIRRAVLGAYMNAKAFDEAGFADPDLALEILRAMAFIGAPVEAAVLLHVPRIRRKLRTIQEMKSREHGSAPGDDVSAADLLKALEDLEKRAFAIKIAHFEEYPGKGEALWQRFGLHSAIAAELRHQFGVPMSESKLSTSFNMSLYVAQPVDGFIPEPAIHDELGKLIDHLIGAYKDIPLAEENPGGALVPLPTGEHCAPTATACLRAALSVVRGYHSTTSLLTIDSDDRIAAEDRAGVLLEHAERLETLLRVYRKLKRARNRAKATDCMALCGPEPFYPDDLVWIHNELGVVYLAQGDLYSARRSFHQALVVNRAAVEFEDTSHNWRRITMNQALVDIERAQIIEAELKLERIERSINTRPPVCRGETTPRFEFIRRQFGKAAPVDRSCFDADIMHEELLMTGLVLGHRALCHHLRGHLRTAEPLYEDAIAILKRLGEHRGYAFFQLRFAQLRRLIHRGEGEDVEIRLAVTAAESVRQMDIAYHARISQAEGSWHHPRADALTRRRALRHLTDALAYSAVMDLHRVRVEAGMTLAKLKLESGDYETALEHATEAMALAARYGLSLRKISLRLDIGQILIRRGDPRSGAALIDKAIEAADRFGYQRAVESAQRIRVEEDLAAKVSRRSLVS
jgi:tetratricopeptide (TPR) repeat protein